MLLQHHSPIEIGQKYFTEFEAINYIQKRIMGAVFSVEHMSNNFPVLKIGPERLLIHHIPSCAFSFAASFWT